MTRLLFRLAAVACIAPLVASCGGGAPRTVSPSSPTANAPLSPNGGAMVPQSAVRGVLVSVHLPLRNSDQLDGLLQRQGDQNSSDYHHFLTPQQFRDQYAPTTADLASAANTLRGMGFETHTTSQSILAAAPQAAVESALGIHLHTTLVHGRAVMSADRAVSLPASLTRLNATIGFSPFVKEVHSKRVTTAAYTPDNRYAANGPYWFDDLKQAYGYPSYQVANGAGRTIAIVMSSDVLDSDLALYFGHEQLTPPVVERRPVNGGPPPFDPNNGASDEASLDVQQSFGSAPGAHIMLYDIPDLSDNNIFAAYSAIVEENRADIVSSSFGLCELYYTKAYNGGTDYTSILQQFHDVFRQGNAQGITFVASSGDNGAYGCTDRSGATIIKGVQNPADDPAVTGVGGTNLITLGAPPSRNSAYAGENADFDTFDPAQGAPPNAIWGSGGGVSQLFAKPWYQQLVQTHANTRTVPDVSMHMGGCPIGAITPCNPARSADVAAIGGHLYLVIGTSASAPEFAGLLAVTEQRLGTRLGNANGYAYLMSALFGSRVYRQNIPGNNGYPATSGYNYVLGLGTPHAAVFAAEPGSQLAGIPQTPTNP
jgi:subtilase family serine protease